MINYETRMLVDALSSPPDSWFRKVHLQKLLKEAHKEYNKTKKLIPVYQAALEHWKEVQRRYQNLKVQGYETIPASKWPQFKSTAEIVQLKKTLNKLQRRSKVDKEYFHKIRSRYMEFLEFEKAWRRK